MDITPIVRAVDQVQLDGPVIYRGHAAFDQYRRVWNAMADRRPAVIVRARSVADVEKIVWRAPN